jgi:hypothetical protein
MDQYCDFEWVSRGSGVEQIGCDFPKGKVDFIGDYGKHECGLRVHHLDAKDRGIWQCEVEKYYMGFSRRSVYPDRKTDFYYIGIFKIKVDSS